MTFKEWLKWYKEVPWAVKWFVILILLRPIIDNFYKLKEVSPFLSPLYIVGALTPALIFFSVISKKLKRVKHSGVGTSFFIFGLLVSVNWIILDIIFPSLDTFGNSIKAITPTILLFYLMYIIRSQRDLHGIMVTFLYSGIYLVVLLVYEYLFGSISGIRVSEGRGGGERFTGFYNDMMNYATYITGAMLISCYFYLRNVYSSVKSKNYTLKFAGVLFICVMGLIGIKHVSTWAVCFAIFTLLALFNLKNFKGFFVLLFFSGIFFAFFGEEIYIKQIEPLIGKEINVASGNYDLAGGLNGRIGRWERYFDIWFNDLPWYSRIIGVPTSGEPISRVMCSSGMHNDYVRNLFSAGILGLFFYLVFLTLIVYRSTHFKTPEKFLIMGSVLALLMHSVSTVPLAYSSYIYLFLSIFSFALLPIRNAYHIIPWKITKSKNRHVFREPVESQVSTAGVSA